MISASVVDQWTISEKIPVDYQVSKQAGNVPRQVEGQRRPPRSIAMNLTPVEVGRRWISAGLLPVFANAAPECRG